MLENESEPASNPGQLKGQVLRVLEAALTPSEADPSRVSLVAALYVLNEEDKASGGVNLTDDDADELDALLNGL
jgi:hypothetical protein